MRDDDCTSTSTVVKAGRSLPLLVTVSLGDTWDFGRRPRPANLAILHFIWASLSTTEAIANYELVWSFVRQ